MPTTQTRDRLTASWPVIGGQACRELRSKFFHCLEAISVSPVSISLATADFSLMYRSLAEGSTLNVEILLADRQATVRLTATNTSLAIRDAVQRNLLHFRLSNPQGTSEQHHTLEAIHNYRLSKAPDEHGVQHWLNHETAAEKEFRARQTQLQLRTTESRLISVESDLQIASDIQQHMLLSKDQLKNIHPLLDCYAYIVPCKEVGGDFFDIINLGMDRFAVVVGDVSGKGVPAAMMMATCSTLIRAYCETDHSPSSVIKKTNNRLLQGNDNDCMFTTVFLAVIDCRKNTVSYCNAGHNPGLIARHNANIDHLSEVHGPALGVFAEHIYEEDCGTFDPGDRIILYSDGVTESFNCDGDLYGFERLTAYCTSASVTANSRRFLGGLLLDINQFSGTELAHDDVTLVAVKRQPAPSSPRDQHHLKAHASKEDWQILKEKVEAICGDLKLETGAIASLLLVLDELVANTISHGQSRASHSIEISVHLHYTAGSLRVDLQDDGPAFNPLQASEPEVDLLLDDREIGGLGLLLVRSLTTNLAYQYQKPLNCVHFELKCKTETAK